MKPLNVPATVVVQRFSTAIPTDSAGITSAIRGHPTATVKKFKSKSGNDDPIRRLAEVLTEEEGVTQDELTALETELANELEEALEFAKNSPEPLPEDALNDVYAGSIQP